MAARDLVLGFLTTENTATGIRGGYLLTSDMGKPIEFHFTSPLKLSASERSLYGKEFDRQILVNLIAKPLTDRQTMPPQLVVVSASALLALRELIPAPVVCISPVLEAEGGGEKKVAGAINLDFPQDNAAFEKILARVPKNFDWQEVFERIRNALTEIRDPTLLAA